MSYNGTTEGSRVEYKCNAPLKAKPTGVSLEYTCGADGQWSYGNNSLQCEGTCTSEFTILNGHNTYMSEDDKMPVSEDLTAEICSFKFPLIHIKF